MKLILIAVIVLFSCTNEEEKQKDEIKELKIKAEAAKAVDDVMKTIGKDIFNKALSLKDDCPVSIQSVKIYKPEYSYSKAYRISYKNKGTKTVDAIKFMIYGENNWGEPEAISIIGAAYTYAEDQSIIRPGKTVSNSWTVSTGEPTKMKAVVIKLHFTDGSLWSAE